MQKGKGGTSREESRGLHRVCVHGYYVCARAAWAWCRARKGVAGYALGIVLCVVAGSVSSVRAQGSEGRGELRRDPQTGVWYAYFPGGSVVRERTVERCTEAGRASWEREVHRRTAAFWERFDPGGQYRSSSRSMGEFLRWCTGDAACRGAHETLESLSRACVGVRRAVVEEAPRRYVLPCRPWASLVWTGSTWADAPGQEGYLERAGGDGFLYQREGVQQGGPMWLRAGPSARARYGRALRTGLVYWLDDAARQVVVRPNERAWWDASAAWYVRVVMPGEHRGRVRAMHVCETNLDQAGLRRLYDRWSREGAGQGRSEGPDSEDRPP